MLTPERQPVLKIDCIKICQILFYKINKIFFFIYKAILPKYCKAIVAKFIFFWYNLYYTKYKAIVPKMTCLWNIAGSSSHNFNMPTSLMID